MTLLSKPATACGKFPVTYSSSINTSIPCPKSRFVHVPHSNSCGISIHSPLQLNRIHTTSTGSCKNSRRITALNRQHIVTRHLCAWCYNGTTWSFSNKVGKGMNWQVWLAWQRGSWLSCALCVPTQASIYLRDGNARLWRWGTYRWSLFQSLSLNLLTSGFFICWSFAWMQTSGSKINWCQITHRILV